MTSRYVTMLLVIAGFALAPASVQASDDDDRPGVAIYPGPGDYEPRLDLVTKRTPGASIMPPPSASNEVKSSSMSLYSASYPDSLQRSFTCPRNSIFEMGPTRAQSLTSDPIFV
mgnify:CR=1 FL=1